MSGLNEKILCYLTDEAVEALRIMTDAGVDADLAVSVLEQLWPETAIYELPDDSEVPVTWMRVL